jgi:hypothetical protein
LLFFYSRAVISVMCPIIAEMVCNRITPVVGPVISDAQHGFVKGRSTVSNLVQFTNGVIGEMENGWQWQVDGVYTDFFKAFDRVLHGLLKLNFAFVLDGVLSDRSNPTCQIGGLFVRIDSNSFWTSTGESLGTNILHSGC